VPRVTRSASLWPVLALAVSAAPVARAEEAPPRPFALELTAAEGCPNVEQFLAALRERTPGAVVVEAGEANVLLEIALERGGRGSIEVTTPAGSSHRELQARSCEEALGATAVIASMILDEEAARRGQAAPAEPTPPEPEPEPEEPPPEAEITPPPVVPERPLPTPPTSAVRGSGLSVMLGIGLETAVASTPPPGLLLGAQAESRQPRWWSPSVHIEGFATLSATERVDAGSGKFRLLTLRLSGCSLNWRPMLAWRLAACVSVDAGSYAAEGTDVAQNAAQRTMPWLALGLAARSRWELTERSSLQAWLGLRRLQRHDEFVIRPDNLVYSVPPFSLGFGLELTWQAL
jgi:hypothetical protein